MKFKDRPADLPDVTYKARYKEGDPVIIHFGTSGFITNCRVTKIHFGGSRIAYDVEVKWQHEWEHHDGMPEFMTARIHNLDYLRVFSPQDFETGENIKHATVIQKAKAYCEKQYGETRDIIMERFTEGQFHETIQDAYVDGYNAAFR